MKKSKANKSTNDIKITSKVLKHQHKFLSDFKTRFLALVGGFGCGKTRSLVLKAIFLASKNCGYRGAMYAPTHTLAMDVLVPEMDDQLEELKIKYEYRSSPLPSYTLYFPNGSCKILIRSFENWRRIRALNLAFAVVDELDVVDPKISRPAFKLLMGRLRVGNVRQLAVVSTPEGFGLLWEFFVKQAPGKTDRRIIRGRTQDNPFIAPDFIESLLENYPPQLIAAYLEGQFVNLNSNQIYTSFDRFKNHCNDQPEPTDRLHIGMDFNVGKMAAIIHVLRDGLPRAVDEILNQQDTPAMIAAIQARFPLHCDRRMITIYPDASGNSRKTNDASTSDIALLRKAGFAIAVDASNPAVKDRINAMNSALCNGKGERRYFINTNQCPGYTEALEQQVWKNGEPDKSQGHDHANDAGGYLINKLIPISSMRQCAGRPPAPRPNSPANTRRIMASA
jgi:hypothetical protein